MLLLKLRHMIPNEDPKRTPRASALVLSNISQFLKQFLGDTESKISIWFMHWNHLNPIIVIIMIIVKYKTILYDK